MPRNHMLIALAVAAVALPGAALASATPFDRDVLTNILLPLKGAGTASGTTTVQIDPKARKVCYVVEQTGLSGTLTGAIMKGSEKIVDLKNARNGDLQGCVAIDQDVAGKIVANPTEYSLSVNNGALSATLSPINNFS